MTPLMVWICLVSLLTGLARADLTINATADGLPVATSPELLTFQADHRQAAEPRRDWLHNPTPLQIILEGAVLAIPAYFGGVAWHEGSHALAVVLQGGDVTEYSVLPETIDGHFTFGHTSWQGSFERDQRVLIDMAPKITDLGILAVYTTLLETGAYPESKPLQLLLVVVASAAWVDFTKDLFTNNEHNDTVRAMAEYGYTEPFGDQLPFRLAWGALALAGAFELGHGIYKLFLKPEQAQRLSRYGTPVVSTNYIGWAGRF